MNDSSLSTTDWPKDSNKSRTIHENRNKITYEYLNTNDELNDNDSDEYDINIMLEQKHKGLMGDYVKSILYGGLDG